MIDLFSRQVVGCALSEDMNRDIVIDAPRMAWFKRHLAKGSGLIFQSDRGRQYSSDDFCNVLKDCDLTASMNRRVNCWDNACRETLFDALKLERMHGQKFRSRGQAKDEVVAWLTRYNRMRRHSTLGYVSPVRLEKNWQAAQLRHASS